MADPASGAPRPGPVVHPTGEPATEEPARLRRSSKLNLVCEECHQPIIGTSGWAVVDMAAATHRGEDFRRWRIEHPNVHTNLSPVPKTPWHLVHSACDKRPQRDHFRVPSKKLATLEGLMYRLLALSDRPWFRHTGFKDLAHALLQGVRD